MRTIDGLSVQVVPTPHEAHLLELYRVTSSDVATFIVALLALEEAGEREEAATIGQQRVAVTADFLSSQCTLLIGRAREANREIDSKT